MCSDFPIVSKSPLEFSSLIFVRFNPMEYKKRGEHCLQMWVWDMKEQCVRAYKNNSLSAEMGKFEVREREFWLVHYFTPL